MTDEELGIDPHTTGVKLDANKIRPFLVLGEFANALEAVSEVGTYGAIKYTENGWVDVPNGFTRYSEALCRHLLLERTEGQRDIEGGSNLRHAAQVAWNSLARLELILRAEGHVNVRPD